MRAPAVGDDRVELVVAAGATLAEGPVWDARSGRLAWVDIPSGRIFLTDVRSGDSDVIQAPLPVGAVAPRAAGGFVAALAGRILGGRRGTGRADRSRPRGPARPAIQRRQVRPGWAVLGRHHGLRRAARRRPRLYRLDPDGTATRVVDGVTISNGLAWSADGRTMYYVDTPTQRIDAFDFTASTGAIGNRRPVVHIPPADGAPDGLTIDAEGGLWVALWGGGAVHRYLDGRLDRVIRLPVSQVNQLRVRWRQTWTSCS